MHPITRSKASVAGAPVALFKSDLGYRPADIHGSQFVITCTGLDGGTYTVQVYDAADGLSLRTVSTAARAETYAEVVDQPADGFLVTFAALGGLAAPVVYVSNRRGTRF
jgi:hypothetical protein